MTRKEYFKNEISQIFEDFMQDKLMIRWFLPKKLKKQLRRYIEYSFDQGVGCVVTYFLAHENATIEDILTEFKN